MLFVFYVLSYLLTVAHKALNDVVSATALASLPSTPLYPHASGTLTLTSHLLRTLLPHSPQVSLHPELHCSR